MKSAKPYQEQIMWIYKYNRDFIILHHATDTNSQLNPSNYVPYEVEVDWMWIYYIAQEWVKIVECTQGFFDQITGHAVLKSSLLSIGTGLPSLQQEFPLQIGW